MDNASVSIPEAGGRMMCCDELPDGGLQEIWLNVFEKLDGKDKPALAGALSVFHDMVEAKRTEILVSEISPLLIEALPERNLLQCRELCQAAENEWIHQNESLSLNAYHFQKPQSAFRISEMVQEFMDEMRGHPGNPFPTRSIGLFFDSFNEENRGIQWTALLRQYTANVRLLLEKFGSHVHFAEMRFSEDEEALAELGPVMGAFLREGLILLPNLKVLSISGECNGPLQDQDIREIYGLNPLPRLNNLEVVKLHNVSSAMVDHFLTCCCVPENIKHLSYDHYEWYGDRLILSEAVYGFANLEGLNAPMLLRDLKRLAELERRPPLRDLQLEFEDNPYFQEVFSLLEVFGETLSQFATNSRMPVRNTGEMFTCNLPNLKELFIVNYLGSPELLFEFEAVAHLLIYEMKDSNGQVVQDLETRIIALNIWNILPSLQMLTLGPRLKTQFRNNRLKWKLRSWKVRSVLMEMVTSTFLDYFSGSLF